MKLNQKAVDLLLAQRKLTQREAAAKAGISDRTIYRAYETDVTPKLIGKLAEALGADVTEIIQRED